MMPAGVPRRKRAFDLLLTIPGLIVLALPLAILGVLIRLRLGSPVLFRQVRPGFKGRPFTLYKFRTMTDERDASGRLLPDERRLTGLGRFLRSFSLDDLPNAFNVLRGEMSVVGPRPERPEFVDQFRNYVPKYLERHRLKTGLTGWAQVNGLRGEVPIAERTNYDLYYIENWSLKLDLRIIFKTLYAVLFGKDAY